MALYVAFLRGMNLGKRRIGNDELCAVFERLGFEGASAFRASGNVIVETAAREKQGELGARIEAGLAAELGYEVPVFVRSGSEVAAIAAAQPFRRKLVDASAGKLQVALLPKKPGKLAAREAMSHSTEEDRLALDGKQLYWLPSGGMRESALDQRALESELGPWTMRTKGTIEQIAARHCAS